MTEAANPAPSGPSAAPPEGEPGRTRFAYGDAAGRPLFYVTRGADDPGFERPGLWGPTPDRAGWQPDLTALSGPLPLFDLAGVLTYRDATIVFHRSERDAVRARDTGLEGLHTTTVMGVGHAAATDFTPLAGRRVVVVSDGSAEGRAYAAEVEGLARGAGAASVEVRDPADVPGPVAEPPAPSPEPASAPRSEAAAPPAFAEPSPLPTGAVPLPPFDPGLLPETLAGFVAAVAARTGSPAVVPAVAMLVTLGAVIGRNLGIRPRAGDDACVVPNLWGAVVADGSAFLDGAALEAAMAPLERLEWRAREAFVRENAHHRARKAAYGVALKVWRDRVRRQAGHGEDVTALAALHPSEPDPPALRRYRTGTGTVKSLVRLLNDNPGGALLAAGDLATWVRHRAGPGREGERDFLLRCGSGAAPGFSFDGSSGEALHCAHPCLSVLGWLTADTRARLLAPGVDSAGAHDLVSRFTLTVCADRPGTPADSGVDPEARARTEALFERVDETVRGAGVRAGTIPAVSFEPDAQGFADAWRADRAVRIAGIEDAGLALALSRQGERMPALALILHLAETADGGAPRPVSARAARRAAAWCELLEAHADRLYGAAGPGGAGGADAAEGARALLQRLLAGDLAAPFTVRDVYRRHWSGLSTPGLAQSAVGLLERHGYLAAEPVPTTVRGGKPTRVYHLNPGAAAGTSTGAG